jgi:hypothetical protein
MKVNNEPTDVTTYYYLIVVGCFTVQHGFRPCCAVRQPAQCCNMQHSIERK